MPKDKHNNRLLTFVLLGISGSGKGTQARYFMERLGTKVYYIQTGALMRELLAQDMHNPTIDGFRTIMGTGGLMPDWLPIYLWLGEFIIKGCADKLLVFDGACRRLKEATMLDDVVAWHNRPLPIAVYIDVSPVEVERRLLARGRKDDTLAAIKNRIGYFSKDVGPVVRYYKRAKRLIHVNGEQSPQDVWRDIDEALQKRLGKMWPR